jgi:hypothetical protein
MYWLPLAITLALTAMPAAPQQKLGEVRRLTAPESFTINANVSGGTGAAASTFTIKVDKYSADADRKAVEDALKQGNAQFLAALAKAPVVGTLTMGGQTTNIRWAREEQLPNGRTIVLVTDKPVYFVGAGAVNPKPREGFDVALVKFRMDDSGVGYDGSMAAAAKVKIGASGIEVQEYGEKLIDLRTVTRAIK